jgi:hypothetical protein
MRQRTVNFGEGACQKKKEHKSPDEQKKMVSGSNIDIDQWSHWSSYVTLMLLHVRFLIRWWRERKEKE